MKTLKVDLGERSYPIYIGAGLISQGELFRCHLKGREMLVVTNETVAPLYLQTLCDALPNDRLDVVILRDGEQYKTLDTLGVIYDKLLSAQHSRGTTLIALGGGVVGDMTGFAAATYQRGVNFLQVPTTLLSQVDSSVGGKTGVNHSMGKNMIGAFHQPVAVIADIQALLTLPEREYRSGIAEVIKYGLISDLAFYRWLHQRVEQIKNRDTQTLIEMIERSCQNKADVVSRDERETDVRAILNLGHTFGHAIETVESYKGLLHGEAVAVGMLMAAELSCRLKWIARAEVEELRAFLIAVGLPVQVPGVMTAENFMAAMTLDKKVSGGVVRLVLLNAIGSAVLSGSYPRQILADVLGDFCR